MRKLKTILVTCVVASSLFATASMAWSRTAPVERGTSWTEGEDSTVWGDGEGISWESFSL